MSKKHMKQLTVMSIILGLTVGTSLIAKAAATHEPTSSIESAVLEGSDAAVAPKFGSDPEDTGNEGTKLTGLLKIDRVPNITFGSIKPTITEQTVYAKNTNPYLQVTDVRGVLSGWTVSAKVSDFTTTTASGQKFILNNAKLKIAQGEVKGEKDKTDSTQAPKNHTVELNKDYQRVMDAEVDKGAGTWASLWPVEKGETQNKKISLVVAQGSTIPGHKYRATITWQLLNAPNTVSGS